MQWETCSERETEAAGARLAARLHPGSVVALYGGLGMGKTAFVRGMAEGMGLSAEVSSRPSRWCTNMGARRLSCISICTV